MLILALLMAAGAALAMSEVNVLIDELEDIQDLAENGPPQDQTNQMIDEGRDETPSEPPENFADFGFDIENLNVIDALDAPQNTPSQDANEENNETDNDEPMSSPLDVFFAAIEQDTPTTEPSAPEMLKEDDQDTVAAAYANASQGNTKPLTFG